MDDITDIEQRIHDLLAATHDSKDLASKKGILIVELCHVHVMNWNRTQDSVGPRAECTVELNGFASPNSELEPVRAYVKVIPDDQPIRQPSYSVENNWIRMEIHRRDQEGLLAIVAQPRWYCWYTEYASGSVYAGLHSGT